MVDAEDEEELRHALALSLQEFDSMAPDSFPKETIDLTANSDGSSTVSEDDHKNNVAKASPPQGSDSNSKTSYQLPSFLSDRRGQEQERLERLKRKRDGAVSPPSLTREVKSTKLDHGPVSSAFADGARKNQKDPQTSADHPDPTSSTAAGLQYPFGVVKQTWAYGSPRHQDIKIEEVLQQHTLESAVLSSFQWDMEWLFTKINPEKKKIILVMQAKEEAVRQQYRAETAGMPSLRLCFPSMEGQVNCMHSKLMLLFQPTYLRIVVPTANLVPYDWGENGGIMENTVFLIDLPRRQSSEEKSGPTAPFYDDLMVFLRAMSLQEDAAKKVAEFDFTRTSKLAFVHSIGGSHVGDDWKLTGHCGFGRAVKSLGLQTSMPIRLDFVASSIGSLNEELLRSIYLAAKGDDGLTEYTLRNAKSLPTKCARDPSRIISRGFGTEWKENFRVYFPTLDTVKKSKGGPRNAGTICFQSKWYNRKTFPRDIMRDCVSRRPGLVMHNKILFVRSEEPLKLLNIGTCHAWAYVGSANLSESAWGRLVQDRVTKRPKLNCRNWECGVIVPIARTSGKKQPDSMDEFDDIVPVPMHTSPEPTYGLKKPWYYTEPSV